ncbi:nitrate/nitrite transporter, partial [Jiangella anatolica]
GGARVTLWNFAAMAAGTIVVIIAVDAGRWPLFLGAFLLVFATTGLGNGSTFRMIPMIFRNRTEAAAVIGLSSAVGAFGGFAIVATFGVLGLVNDGRVPTSAIATAFVIFLGFYVSCALLTWWNYGRRGSELAGADI